MMKQNWKNLLRLSHLYKNKYVSAKNWQKQIYCTLQISGTVGKIQFNMTVTLCLDPMPIIRTATTLTTAPTTSRKVGKNQRGNETNCNLQKESESISNTNSFYTLRIWAIHKLLLPVFLSCIFYKFWNTIDDDLIYGWPCIINILTQTAIQIAMSLPTQHGSNNSANLFWSNDIGWTKTCSILNFSLI